MLKIMKKQRKLYITFLSFLVVLFSGFITRAQTPEQATELVKLGKYSEARNVCFAILEKGYDPDVALIIGRTYSWEQNYDSARVVISEVLQKYPNYPDALEAIIDVEFLSGNYPKALEYCNLALQKNNSGALNLKKADILFASGKKSEAVKTLKNYMETNSEDKSATYKLQQFQRESKKNEIRYTYTVDFFDKDFNRDPWQIHSLQYKIETKAGAFIARVNYAKRFSVTGYQVELDAYPKLNANNYFYLNYGYSNSLVFPENRFGAEWFHSFSNKMEISAGMRMFFYESTNVDFYTLMLGKYVKNNLFSLRTFITPEQDFPSVTAIAEARHFFPNPQNYIGLKLGVGSSPDEIRNTVNAIQRLQVHSQWLRTEFSHLLSPSLLLGLNFTAGREELTSKKYSGYYSVESRLSFLF
jgi:YaiO family outer membrane protein